MWRWLLLFLFVPCIHGEDACASITGEVSRMRCYKRQAANQKKSPMKKHPLSIMPATPNVPKDTSSLNQRASSVLGAQPTGQLTIPQKKNDTMLSAASDAGKNIPLDAPRTEDLASHSSGSEKVSRSAEPPVPSSGVASSIFPESSGFYAYESDRIGTDSKGAEDHVKSLKHETASSLQHKSSHFGLGLDQSLVDSASHTMKRELLEASDVPVYYQGDAQSGTIDALPSMQDTWGE